MVVYALYFVSGAAGLVFETVFLRQATWLVGSAASATALVLAAFMAGLALGSATGGPLADGCRRPLALYGILEIGTGVAGALLTLLLGSGRDVLAIPLRAIGPGPLERAAAFALSLLLLLVPAALMGASLPALSRFAIREPGRLLGPLGALYGANTLGGAVGAVGAGFVLFERLGVSRSGYLAASADVAVGIAAILLDLRLRARAPKEAATRGGGSSSERRGAAQHVSPALRAACLGAAAVGGASVLGYEVVWTRILSLPMRSYAYSFSLMLGLFLLGLVIGAWVLAALSGRVRDPVLLLAGTELAMGLYVAASVLWLPSVLSPPEASGFASFLARAALLAAPVVLPPTILSGMALPFVARSLAEERERIATGVGTVVAANTAGAIAGAVAAGLVLLPLLGAPRALALLATANAAAGGWVAIASTGGAARKAVAWVLAASCAAAFFVPAERFLGGFLSASRGKERIAEVLMYREGATDTIAVVRKDYGFHDPEAKSLITNGVAMSATVKPVWRYMALEGHLPVLLAAKPSRALAVCLGTGITLGAVASHPGVGAVDAVELSEGVLEALPLFAEENGRAYADPRVRIHREDGRHWLEMSADPYDVITLEPPPPIVAGSVHLYSLDFYRLCRRRLSPGGVVAQWLPLHAQSLDSARMAARTFLEAFPHVQLYLPSIRDAVLVGSADPIRLDLGRLDKAYGEAATAANLKAAFVETPEALLATFLLGREGVEAFAGDAPLVTDDRPRMEFFRGRGSTMGDREIASLAELPQGRWDFISGIEADPDRLRRVEIENRALRLYLESEIRDDPAAGLEAARSSRGTEFFLYRLGCATPQRRYLLMNVKEAPGWRDHLAWCETLMDERNRSTFSRPDAAGR